MRARFAIRAACVALAGSWAVRSEAQTEPAASAAATGANRLEYVAPAQCPAQNEWLSRVRARLPREEGWSLERLAAVPARVTVAAAGTEARVVFHDGGLERSIAGADCDEVASAAALILAIALGSSPPPTERAVAATRAETAAAEARALASASSRRGEAAALAAAASGAPAAAAGSEATRASSAIDARSTVVPGVRRPGRARGAKRPSGAVGQGADARAAPNLSPARDARAAADARIDARPSSPSDTGGRRWSIALGASAEANAWTGPWPAGVLGLSVDAASPSRSWSARAVGSYGASERVIDGRRAEFQYWGGALDLCPLALGDISAWRWASCAELHVGLLRASGDERSSLATGISQRALLATAVATTRLQTPALWAMRLQLEAGVAVPLVRQTFQFGTPEQVVFESPAVGLLARAGILVPLDGQRD